MSKAGRDKAISDVIHPTRFIGECVGCELQPIQETELADGGDMNQCTQGKGSEKINEVTRAKENSEWVVLGAFPLDCSVVDPCAKPAVGTARRDNW